MKIKKDILFIGLHRPNRSPSQRYRIEQFIPFLESKGVSYEYAFLLDQKMDKVFYAPKTYLGKAWIVVRSLLKLIHITFFKAKHFQTIFVQREAFMLGTAFFEKQMAKRSYLVFDFDDSIWMQNVSQANRKLAFLKNADKTKDIIQSAALVIVGNTYLEDYAKQFNKNVAVIPTCIDTDEYKPAYPKVEKTKVCIGWSGSQTTIEHFKILEPVLLLLKEKYTDSIYFKVIGDSTYQHKELGIKGVSWTRETEIMELGEIDIGVMPLPNDEWSKGKCALKGLVYMSMEIAAVLQGVGVNSEIVEEGKNGLLANDETDWVDAISKLVDDKALRLSLGKEGRQTILRDYAVKNYKEMFRNYLSEEAFEDK